MLAPWLRLIARYPRAIGLGRRKPSFPNQAWRLGHGSQQTRSVIVGRNLSAFTKLAERYYSTDARQPDADKSILVDKFEHDVLPDNEHVRLLLVYRKEEELNIPYQQVTLQGNLLTVPLEEVKDKYEALSYVWGDPTLSETIFLDDRSMQITKSCASALRRLLADTPARLIWVDSICINQGNDPAALKERGGQVSIMDEIYSSALNVAIYLGEGNAGTDTMFEVLKKLEADLVGATEAQNDDEITAHVLQHHKTLAEVTDIIEKNMYHLLNLPWFDRAWVLQEAALAKKATVYCGSNVMSFENMAVACNLRLTFDPLKLSPGLIQFSWILDYHNRMSTLLRDKQAGRETKPVLLQDIILHSVAKLYATRPEDNIYALYGLCKRLGYQLPFPDYFKPLSDLDFEMAEHYLKYDKTHKFLLKTLGMSSLSIGLPSWVPNTGGMAHVHFSTRSPSMSPASGIGCSASGNSLPQYELNCRKLKVKGRIVDKVLKVGEVLRAENLAFAADPMLFIITALENCIPDWWRTLRVIKALGHRDDGNFTYHVDGQPFDLAAAELLSMTKVIAKEGIPKERLDSIVPSLEQLWSRLTHVQPEVRKWLTSPQDTGLCKQVADGYVISSSIEKLIMELLTGNLLWKSLGYTNRCYLAMFPFGTQTGDLVVILHGLWGPVVIRPVGDSYHLIGSTYVQGIMEGEFWDKTSESKDEWFELI